SWSATGIITIAILFAPGFDVAIELSFVCRFFNAQTTRSLKAHRDRAPILLPTRWTLPSVNVNLGGGRGHELPEDLEEALAEPVGVGDRSGIECDPDVEAAVGTERGDVERDAQPWAHRIRDLDLGAADAGVAMQ